MTAAVMVMVLSGTAFHLIQISTEIHLTVTPPPLVSCGVRRAVCMCVYFIYNVHWTGTFEELAR